MFTYVRQLFSSFIIESIHKYLSTENITINSICITVQNLNEELEFGIKMYKILSKNMRSVRRCISVRSTQKFLRNVSDRNDFLEDVLKRWWLVNIDDDEDIYFASNLNQIFSQRFNINNQIINLHLQSIGK